MILDTFKKHVILYYNSCGEVVHTTEPFFLNPNATLSRKIAVMGRHINYTYAKLEERYYESQGDDWWTFLN
jgi:hypothetical protein